MQQWLDPVFLSRIQFAFVVSFHIIFPAFTIGLASWLAVLEGMWLKTKHPIYKEIYLHWVKIFAVTFGMGVVSGVVMAYQFGTNWSEFSHKAGNVIGPLLSFEVLTAFFLEASFLGIMLFGWNRVGPRLHFFSTLMVAIGTIISAFWILSVNSWMNTPAGFYVGDNGVLFPTNWFEVVFNPSFKYRFIHMIIGAYLATAFAVAGIGAWYLRKKTFNYHGRIIFTMALVIITVLPVAQLIVGHEHGINTQEYQPAKVAAMEGIWETEKGAALNLFGIPNEKTETTEHAFQIPKAASVILKGSLNGEVKGLKDFPKAKRPPVATVFYSFRVMVGIGMLMILTGFIGLFLYWRKSLFNPDSARRRWFHKWCILMAPSGFVAILAGWITTEVGRQPYTVYGVLETAKSASNITVSQVSISLLTFIFVYTIIFGAGLYYLLKLIKKGPKEGDWHDAYGTHGLKNVANVLEIFPKKFIG